MPESIFYSTVDKKVQDVLNLRKRIYAASNRTSTDHAWLFRKMASASAIASNPKTNKTASLIIPTRGGLGRRNQQGNSQGGLYKGVNYTADGRFLPKPHLNTVKISNDGDFGSILKCNITFTIYSRADLDAWQPFFDIGADLVVNYGWNEAGPAGGKAGKFDGVIYNFSYSLNPGGYFDCTCDAMSAGVNTLGINVNAAVDPKGQSYKDPLGQDIPASTASSKIKMAEQAAQFLGISNNKIQAIRVPATVGNFDVEIGALALPTNPSTESSSTDNGSGEKSATDQYYYVSLESIVTALNKLLIEPFVRYRGNVVKLVCNKDVTRGFVPKDTNLFVSANPYEVIFPGFGNYGTTDDYGFSDTDQASEFTSGNLSKIMVNTQFLTKIFYELGAKRDDQTKSVNQSIANFLKRILDSVYNNSGTRFKISITENPKNPYEFWLVDANYFESKPESVFEITAVTTDGICRTVSLVAKVPSEMQTAAFVQNRSTVAISNIITPGTEAPTGPSTASSTPKDDLIKVKRSISYSGATEENMINLRAALKRVYTEGPNGNDSDAVKNEATPVPIDFTATVDGIEGIIFGNTVTCNYLPSVYKKGDIAFTVTKVEHNISGNDWTTTISTVCRLVPKE